jgi:RNA ligase (TIGR02306 family)
MEAAVKSTHRVEVVPVVLEKHPNADSLSVVKVFGGGYEVVVRTQDWEGVNVGAYVPPDSTLDTSRPEFSFLAKDARPDGRARIRARKLRGVVSFGLLVPAPAGAGLGDDVAGVLGVEHYEPEPAGAAREGRGSVTGGEAASAPNVYHVKYDLESARRYHECFLPGEPVVVTEKLDGTSARYVWLDGQYHCGSRTEWKKEYPSYDHLSVEKLTASGVPEERAREILDRLHSKPKARNLWWDILDRTPSLQKFLRDHPGVVAYGEVYGNTNCIKYGLPEGNRFAAFDLMRDGRWLDAEEARALGDELPWAPTLTPFVVGLGFAAVPYDFDRLCEMAEGESLVFGARAGTIREGVVVSPLRERYDHRCGRVKLKLVSAAFLEKYH